MILGKIIFYIGLILMIFFSAISILAFSESDMPNGAGYVCLLFVFASLVISAIGATRQDLFKNYSLYKDVLASSRTRSVHQLAALVNQPVEGVIQNLQNMRQKKLFLDVTLDYTPVSPTSPDVLTGPVSRASGAPAVSVSCPGCGAPNTRVNDVSTCEYCDSPLPPGQV